MSSAKHQPRRRRIGGPSRRGRVTPRLIRMHTREDWVRRYWFEKPIAMPAGTRVEIVADLQDPDQLASAAFGGFAPPARAPATQEPQNLRLSLDVTTHPMTVVR